MDIMDLLFMRWNESTIGDEYLFNVSEIDVHWLQNAGWSVLIAPLRAATETALKSRFKLPWLTLNQQSHIGHAL